MCKELDSACLARGKLSKSWLLIPRYNLRQVTSSLSSFFSLVGSGVNNIYLRVIAMIQRG